MTEQQKESLSIIPRGEEARTTFVNRLNEWLKLEAIRESSLESQKDILEAIAEDHVSVDESVKKTDVKKRVKLLLDEELKAKASEQLSLAEEVIEDHSIVRGKLI